MRTCFAHKNTPTTEDEPGRWVEQNEGVHSDRHCEDWRRGILLRRRGRRDDAVPSFHLRHDPARAVDVRVVNLRGVIQNLEGGAVPPRRVEYHQLDARVGPLEGVPHRFEPLDPVEYHERALVQYRVVETTRRAVLVVVLEEVEHLHLPEDVLPAAQFAYQDA